MHIRDEFLAQVVRYVNIGLRRISELRVRLDSVDSANQQSHRNSTVKHGQKLVIERGMNQGQLQKAHFFFRCMDESIVSRGLGGWVGCVFFYERTIV